MLPTAARIDSHMFLRPLNLRHLVSVHHQCLQMSCQLFERTDDPLGCMLDCEFGSCRRPLGALRNCILIDPIVECIDESGDLLLELCIALNGNQPPSICWEDGAKGILRPGICGLERSACYRASTWSKQGSRGNHWSRLIDKKSHLLIIGNCLKPPLLGATS